MPPGVRPIDILGLTSWTGSGGNYQPQESLAFAEPGLSEPTLGDWDLQSNGLCATIVLSPGKRGENTKRGVQKGTLGSHDGSRACTLQKRSPQLSEAQRRPLTRTRKDILSKLFTPSGKQKSLRLPTADVLYRTVHIGWEPEAHQRQPSAHLHWDRKPLLGGQLW